MKTHFFFPLLAVSFIGGISGAHAQWTSQQINLNPGWNAIYLEVHPEPADTDQVFAGLPIDSIWEWRRIQEPAQFVNDANQLIPKSAEWATWFPTTHPRRILTDLFVLRGGKPLLVNFTGNASATVTITGKPARPQNEWLPSGYSLAGMPVDATGAPTFQAFFAASIGHVGSPASSTRPLVFTLNASGTWTTIPNTTVIQRGKAYWVQTVGPASYEGPLKAGLDSTSGIHFGGDRDQAPLTFRNLNATGNRTVTIQPLPSLSRPSTALDSPVVAGSVALSYRDLDSITPTAPVAPWLPFAGPLTFVVAPGQEKLIQLAVRRQNFAAPAGGSGPDYTYQSLVEIKEGGTRQVVGVSAVKETVASVAGRAPRDGNPAPDRSGLWVGSVTVDGVSWAGDKSPNIVQANPAFNGADRTTPRATPTEFQFKLIVHVDQNGSARLLQKVIQVWENGTYVPDPNNQGKLLPGIPGSYRFFTDEQAASGAGFNGTALRDGKFVARRLSSANFGIRQPVACNTSGGLGGGPLTATVVTGYNDALNPYKHSFHPQHDNLDALYSATPLPAGIESFDINRALTLQFEAVHPYGKANDPSWGSSILGGTYLETLNGPHRRTIYIKGKFLLSRVSNINRLN